jgi:hypothetical protein
LEIALSEKQIPQVIRNIRKLSKGLEPLERGLVLAKQVLSNFFGVM